jgi:hypothetical protein
MSQIIRELSQVTDERLKHHPTNFSKLGKTLLLSNKFLKQRYLSVFSAGVRLFFSPACDCLGWRGAN